MTHRLLLVAAIGLLSAVVVAQFVRPSGILFQDAWAASDSGNSTEAKTPVYLPPMRGAPTRRVGAATRGIEDDGIFLTVLAPEGMGLTSHERPTLYWFVSRAPTRQVEFALTRDDRSKPVMEAILGKPAAGGVFEISLAELGVKLEPGVIYEWSVTLVEDPRESTTDIVTSATLLRRAPSGALESRLATADAEGRFALYGKAGYWYDAIDLASRKIASAATPRRWRGHRASFLEQVGLKTVADFDRST